MELQLIPVSQQLLRATKTGNVYQPFVELLQAIPNTALGDQLSTDDYKKAFWINIYNAYIQILLTQQPDKYIRGNRFFSKKLITIANTALSFDDIEHGILRKSCLKWSLGYMYNLFPSAFEKAHRVQNLDYRIHFALNCGARSCPPIAFYDPQKLEQQLQLATSAYLQTEIDYDQTKQQVYLPAIMKWFSGDFGGKTGTMQILKQHGIIPLNKHPRIKFKKYNWNLLVSNFADEV